MPCRYRLPQQQHFYMEPQAAVAIPDEGGSMLVHSATQGLDAVQASVAKALGCPMNQVIICVPLPPPVSVLLAYYVHMPLRVEIEL